VHQLEHQVARGERKVGRKKATSAENATREFNSLRTATIYSNAFGCHATTYSRAVKRYMTAAEAELAKASDLTARASIQLNLRQLQVTSSCVDLWALWQKRGHGQDYRAARLYVYDAVFPRPFAAALTGSQLYPSTSLQVLTSLMCACVHVRLCLTAGVADQGPDGWLA
jgi:hypothetical protein